MILLRWAASSLWVRALVSAGLLALVLTQADLGLAARYLADASWGWFVLSVVVVFVALVVGAVRWHRYLVAALLKAPLLATLRSFFIGAFATNFLPSQVGGDVARTWIVSGPGTRTRAATTVVIDRANSVVCLVLVAWIIVGASGFDVPRALVVTLAVVTTLVLVAGVLATLLAVGGQRARRLLPSRVHSLGREARDAASACMTRVVLLETLAYGLVFQGLMMLAAWLIALSIALDVPFSTLVAILPPVVVLGAVPISIGGLGVREASFVVLLSEAGVGTTEATVYSLLTGLAFALASSPGAIALLSRRGDRGGATRDQPRSSP